ncbi:hypothetical protein E2C01_058762 [Portunus trituberculatus]|uniref:Uncharacterized protein n=1 Tax=Portunus trituberculatus TaxID=210409 RepID=A0A5B7H729_PORTR|nr:hypothetical protein [Portunus trituberculatus]
MNIILFHYNFIIITTNNSNVWHPLASLAASFANPQVQYPVMLMTLKARPCHGPGGSYVEMKDAEEEEEEEEGRKRVMGE